MLSFLSRKYVESKYRRNNLRIIERISALQFDAILQSYTDHGWELTDNYRSFDENHERWRGKLRKGTSTLVCDWRTSRQGCVSGPARVVNGLGQEFGFTVQAFPSK